MRSNLLKPGGIGLAVSRRQFLKVAGTVGLSAAGMTLLNAYGKPQPALASGADTLETTTIKIPLTPSLCHAPHVLAEDLLKSEGFTEVQYVKMTTGLISKSLVSGDINIGLHFSAPSIIQMDAGTPLVFLAGAHVGCFKVFGSDQIQAIADLKGKSVAITEIGGSDHAFLSVIVASGGLDPNKDVNWVTHTAAESKQLFTDGKLDALIAFPPLAQELTDKKIGHVVVNSMMDKPWSDYFCCMVTTSRDFLLKNPVATKRAMRALLKASDICALQPEKVARFLVDKGFTSNYDYAREAMREIPYNVWRSYDPSETVRFYAQRLHDAEMVKRTPDQILAQGSDWSVLKELQQELKL
jgi:NitT/TauT family transport system substrate-binding protein